jgi:NADH-quinone oxidoreductase subunit L
MENIFNAQQVLFLALLAILAPLLAFILALIFKKFAQFFGILSIGISFISSLILFLGVWKKQKLHFSFNWIQLPNVKIGAGILLNDLTVIMLLLISFIALLVTIYSVEYMRKDNLKYRYFSYLSLFCFAMLALVMANNLFVVYLFWELVGFASYLLIGFWFSKEKAAQASKKAFIMNRIGDVGFLIGLMILLTQFHTLDIDDLFGSGNLIASSFVKSEIWATPFGLLPHYWLTIVGFCFFTGAIAKSAQFPLHTWLPDAMEGPTAVSSLIHAATMVAAGVFLLLRVAPLFDQTVLNAMVIIGLFTAFMAATIALTQSDIKKVLAFSTISQLGFMILAVGIQNQAAAIFHLVTHAFFKCLLFLAAGMVIHQLHHIKSKNKVDFDEQDLNLMGGFRKHMPITTVVFIIASFALSGLPFTSGYLSKDAILISVFEWSELNGGLFWLFPMIVSITSWLTTFYIFRVVFKVFFGEFTLPELLKKEIKELQLTDPNAWMKIPVIILALFCFGFVFAFNPFHLEGAWLYQGFNLFPSNHSIYKNLVPIYINVLSFALIFVTYNAYAKKSFTFNLEQSFFYKLSYNQWYFNQFYDVFLMRLVMLKARAYHWFDQNIIDGIVHAISKIAINLSKVSAWTDRYIIDGFVNSIAVFISLLGASLRRLQSGKLQHYYIWMLLLFLTFMIFKIII